MYLPHFVRWNHLDFWYSNSLYTVKYLNSVFVAGESNGDILTFSTRNSWNSRTSGITNNIRGIIYFASTYLISTNRVNTLYSSDAIILSSGIFGLASEIMRNVNDVTYWISEFIAVVNYVTTITSSDGIK